MAINKVVMGEKTLIDLTNDTVTAAKMLSGTTAHDKAGAVVTGTIASQAAQTITPGTSNKTIAAGKYLSGTQTIKGDANLKAANIKSGVSIFGVSGSFTGSINPYAAIGVIYPPGSKCTCTFGSTEYTAPDTTGQCVFNIPSDGTWTITSETQDGSKSNSKDVTINGKGQFESVTITYGLYLFKEGVGVHADYTVKWGTVTGGSTPHYEITNDAFVWSTMEGVGDSFNFNPTVQCDEYSALWVDLTLKARHSNSTNYGVTIGVGSDEVSSANGAGSWKASSGKFWKTDPNANNGTIERRLIKVPLENVSGQLFVKAHAYATTGTIHNLWLEG